MGTSKLEPCPQLEKLVTLGSLVFFFYSKARYCHFDMEACVLGKLPPFTISVLRIFVAVKNRFGSYLPQENSFHDKLGHFSSVGTS